MKTILFLVLFPIFYPIWGVSVILFIPSLLYLVSVFVRVLQREEFNFHWENILLALLICVLAFICPTIDNSLWRPYVLYGGGGKRIVHSSNNKVQKRIVEQRTGNCAYCGKTLEHCGCGANVPEIVYERVE